MEFAIVDVETTGGHAAGNSITEVAIVIHDGKQVVKRFETLVNPHSSIPYFITRLTGITTEMVSNAPTFSAVANEIFNLLNGRVFVAHAVNFDYSFLKSALKVCGYDLNCPNFVRYVLVEKCFRDYRPTV